MSGFQVTHQIFDHLPSDIGKSFPKLKVKDIMIRETGMGTIHKLSDQKQRNISEESGFKEKALRI